MVEAGEEHPPEEGEQQLVDGVHAALDELAAHDDAAEPDHQQQAEDGQADAEVIEALAMGHVEDPNEEGNQGPLPLDCKQRESRDEEEEKTEDAHDRETGEWKR